MLEMCNAPQGANNPSLPLDPIEATQEVISDDGARLDQIMALFSRLSRQEQRWFMELVKALTMKDIGRARLLARRLEVSDELPQALKAFKCGEREPGVSAGHSDAAAPAGSMGGAA